MKKILFVLIALMLLTSVVAQEDEDLSPGVELGMQLLKYEPVPAHPGDSIDVWVKLDNGGGDFARNVELEFIDNYPFSLESSSRKVHSLGALAGGYDYVAKFKVRVDRDAPVGTSYVKTQLRWGSAGNKFVEEYLPLDIESRITSLMVKDVSISPASLAPGQEGTLSITVKNMVNAEARNVVVRLGLNNENVPLVPINSPIEQKIDSLKFGDEATFEFTFVAQLDATANAYKIPLNLSFQNDAGTEVSYEDLIGVMITSKPDLTATVDSRNVYADGQPGDLTLQFVNKGVDEIKFVYAVLHEHSSYELLSPSNEFYVGNIDTDDYEVQEISLKSKGEDHIILPMTITYSDAANKEFSVEKELSVRILQKQDLEEQKSPVGTIIVVLVILGLIGFYFWRRKKK